MAPLCQEGGFGGDPPPHSRSIVGPLSQEGGLGGSSPHSRGLVGPLSHIYLSSPLNTILREGNGYAEGSPQHLCLILYSAIQHFQNAVILYMLGK